MKSWFLQPQEISRSFLSFASKLLHSHTRVEFSAAQVSTSYSVATLTIECLQNLLSTEAVDKSKI